MSTGIKQFDGVLQFVIMVRLLERERKRKRESEQGRETMIKRTCSLYFSDLAPNPNYLRISAHKHFFHNIISFHVVRKSLNCEAYKPISRIQGTLLSHQHLHEIV